MKKHHLLVLLTLALSALVIACAPTSPTGNASQNIVAAFQKGGCGTCHTIPGIPNAQGNIGSDMSQMGELAAERIQAPEYGGKADSVEAYLRESVTDPDVFLPAECPTGPALTPDQTFA